MCLRPFQSIHYVNTQSTSNRYRNYVLAMLTIVYVFNFIDRQLLVILQESIKADLGLSDTQLGLLTGFTFAIFYVTLGIPIARIADRWNRRNVVAASLAVWSAMTALSGAVQNFVQLLLARIGVGIGEAGGSPPAHAMISDYFPPHQRGRAMSIYSMGIYFGVLFGFLVGGYLNEIFGWRLSFVMLGVPGVIFAGVLYTTVKEPVRGATDTRSLGETTTSFLAVAKVLASKRSFILLSFAAGCHAFATYGMGNWMPSLLMRLHDMSSSDVGTSLGLIMGLGGASGTFLSGVLADRLANADKRWYLRIPALGAAIGMPCSLIAILSDQTGLALAALVVMYLTYAFFLAPCLAVTHNMVPAHMRAFSSAILFFVLNLIGLGFGPMTIGVLSDNLQATYGDYSLRMAMLATAVMASLGIVLFLLASRRVRKDIE